LETGKQIATIGARSAIESRTPRFMQVAAKPSVDQAYLLGIVTELHLPMPTFRLSAEDQQDVIAYISSLRAGP